MNDERMNDELVEWLLSEGMAEEKRGFGHVTAEELAEALLERFEMKRK